MKTFWRILLCTALLTYLCLVPREVLLVIGYLLSNVIIALIVLAICARDGQRMR